MNSVHTEMNQECGNALHHFLISAIRQFLTKVYVHTCKPFPRFLLQVSNKCTPIWKGINVHLATKNLQHTKNIRCLLMSV